MNRPAKYAALFAQLPADGYVTRGRRLKHWADVPALQQPALFLTFGDETALHLGPGTRRSWTTLFKIYVYVHASDQAFAPSELLATHVDAIEAALEPSPGEERQQLGGLVQAVRLTNLQTDEGHLGDQAVAILTGEMVHAP